VVDACRNLHRQGALVMHAPLSATVATGIGDDLTGSAAMRTGLLDRKDAVLHAYAAVALARGTTRRLAVGRTAAAATVAGDQRRNLDLLVDAEHGLLEVEFDQVAKVGPTPRAIAP